MLVGASPAAQAAVDETPIRRTRRARMREDLEQAILMEAERIFADKGFNGTSVLDIAEVVGLSKQNLMYYFPTKKLLYEKVLDNVLDDWLQSMKALAHTEMSAEDALAAYIRAKLEFSKRRPTGSRVYALELIGGAKVYGRQIQSKVVPALREDIATLNRWLQRTATPVSAEHLMFVIWAATQSYADFAAQMRLILGTRSMTGHFFADAEATLSTLVCGLLRQQRTEPVPGTSRRPG
jgi:TetR/AcrR family transcriptional regulator